MLHSITTLLDSDYSVVRFYNWAKNTWHWPVKNNNNSTLSKACFDIQIHSNLRPQVPSTVKVYSLYSFKEYVISAPKGPALLISLKMGYRFLYNIQYTMIWWWPNLPSGADLYSQCFLWRINMNRFPQEKHALGRIFHKQSCCLLKGSGVRVKEAVLKNDTLWAIQNN